MHVIWHPGHCSSNVNPLRQVSPAARGQPRASNQGLPHPGPRGHHPGPPRDSSAHLHHHRVPWPGWDSMRQWPPAAVARSLMVMRPQRWRPSGCPTRSWSKPTPLSAITSRPDGVRPPRSEPPPRLGRAWPHCSWLPGRCGTGPVPPARPGGGHLLPLDLHRDARLTEELLPVPTQRRQQPVVVQHRGPEIAHQVPDAPPVCSTRATASARRARSSGSAFRGIWI